MLRVFACWTFRTHDTPRFLTRPPRSPIFQSRLTPLPVSALSRQRYHTRPSPASGRSPSSRRSAVYIWARGDDNYRTGGSRGPSAPFISSLYSLALHRAVLPISIAIPVNANRTWCYKNSIKKLMVTTKLVRQWQILLNRILDLHSCPKIVTW